MRREFFTKLYQKMFYNKDIIAISIDLGYGGFDRIRDNLPSQFINTGAAEQGALDLAVGLAQSGKIPVVYSITPFLICRPYETIRTYINHEKINVKLVGSGRDNDYIHDGYSHFAGDDKFLMYPFDNIQCKWPNSVKEMEVIVDDMFESKDPYYLNLKR